MSHIKTEDDEVDFMSDEFLAECTKNDIRPGLLFKSSEKRDHEQIKRKHEAAQKQLGRKQMEEVNRTTGLETPIGSDNKGFKMLAKMGFKPGESLGKRSGSCGEVKDPIPIQIKRGRVCLGDKTVQEEKTRRIEALGDATSFRERLQASSLANQNIVDLDRARRICHTLDSRSGCDNPIEPWYWPTLPKSKVTSNSDTELELLEDSEEDDEKDTDDLLQRSKEQLDTVVDYLRTTYSYCVWCGTQFDDAEDMVNSCPGLTRDNH